MTAPLEPDRPLFVRAPNWVGDVVMATGPLVALARRYPGRVTVGIKPHLAPILDGLPVGERILPVGRPRSLRALLGEVARLRAGRFGAALLLTRSVETALIPWLARVPVRIGTLEGRSLLLNRGFREPRQTRRRAREPKRVPRYMADLFADVLALAGVEGVETRPRLAVTPAEEEQVAAWRRAVGLAAGASYFLLNPGAAFGASKLWPPEYMARTGAELGRRTGLQGVVLSGPAAAEQRLAEEIAAGGKGLVAATGARLVRLGPLKGVVRDARVMVTTDSGPRHYAVAFRTPHLAVIGPTDPRFTDRHLEEARVLHRSVPCGPCHLRVCDQGHHRCLREITPEEVLENLADLLRHPPGD